MHYWTDDGRKVLDGVAGLWCVNAGHGRKEITEAVSKQLATMEYAPPFQMGHPPGFELASRLVKLAPGDIDHVFFTNSGSEAVDTALKIAIAYHRLRGEEVAPAAHRTREGLSRRRLRRHVGRRHGEQPQVLRHAAAGVDHLRHTHDLEHNAFSRGVPEWGAHLADDLERLVALHDASTIAAVIVEPVAGSGRRAAAAEGLPGAALDLRQARHSADLRRSHHGFGRLGAPFGAQYFDVLPDMITSAKALTNGAIPMGAVFVRKHIYDAFMKGPENAIELFHGYTYSAHPTACAAGLAVQDIYEREGLLTRGAKMAKTFEEAVHRCAACRA